ncbi:MAG TPA: DUF4350 domain-containing protein [Gaiellaceae bacterium]|nr:DUF4350 domain-containing protein [Gaiellaceae bacterium]
MSRAWRIGLTVVAVVVAANLVLRFLGSVTGGTPGGPRSSSYATSRAGTAAFAELLGRAGHPVEQVRTLPHSSAPSPRATVFLLDPPAVAPGDVRALLGFVRTGGRLVAGGVSPRTLRELVPNPPGELGPGVRSARARGLGGVQLVQTAAEGAWAQPGVTRPLVSARGRTVLVESRRGRGRIYLLADSSPLQNRLLVQADNAALGLALAGPPSRPAQFLESYHGFGRSSGLAALPLAWKLLLGGLGLAALVYMLARGRRFGPPEPEGRELPPPRREYVDALAASLARTKRRDEAVERVRREAREALLRRVAQPPGADDAAVREAARRAGLPDADAEALLGTVRTDEDVLAVGRALARIGQDHR